MMKVRVDVRTTILYVTKSGFTEVQIVPAVLVLIYIYILKLVQEDTIIYII